MSLIQRYRLLPATLIMFACALSAQAGQTLSSSTTTVTLQTINSSESDFELPAAGSITTSGTAVIGDSSKDWQLTNYGTMSGGNGTAGDGVNLGGLTAGASVVINHGLIEAKTITGGAFGVQFTKGGQVYNQAGGDIKGYDGVHADNGLLTVENLGTIEGLSGGGSAVYSGQGAIITNHLGAVIRGQNYALNVNGFNTSVIIRNYGTMDSKNEAVHLYNGNEYAVYNAPTGYMHSTTNRTIYLGGDNGYLLNEGVIQSEDDHSVLAESGLSGNVYVNAGTITANGGSGIYVKESGSIVYNLSSLSGTAAAVTFEGSGNQLVLGSQTYLSKIGRMVYGPGSQLNGDAVVVGAGSTNNQIRLTDSGSEDSTFTGFTSLAMDGQDWTLSNTLALAGTAPDTLSVNSGTLSLTGDLAIASGGVTVNSDGTLAMYKGLATPAVTVNSGGVFEYGGSAGSFSSVAVNALPGSLFRLSRMDSALELDAASSLDLAAGSRFGVTVGIDPASHSVLKIDSFAPADGALLDINGHTLHGVGVSILPAGGTYYQGVVQTNNPVVIPQSMQITANPLLGAALIANGHNADLGLYLRNINDVYGPSLDAADVWRQSFLPDPAQRRWLDNIYRTGALDAEGKKFFQLLDGPALLAPQEAYRSNRRRLLARIDDRLWLTLDPAERDLATAQNAFAADSALAMPAAAASGRDWRPRNTIWADVGQRWADQKSRGNILGYDYNPFGFVLGFDHTRGNWTLGLAAQYDQGKVKSDSGEDAVTEIKGATAGLYAIYQTPRWYGRAGVQAGYGWNREHTNYSLWKQTSRASYNSSLFGGDIEFGYHLELGEPRLPFRITPHIGLDYGRLHQEAFRESGAPSLDRSFAGNNYDVFETPVGVRLSKAFLFGRTFVTPSLDLSYAHNFGDARAASVANFIALPNQGWRVNGIESGRDAFRMELGVNARINRCVDLGLSYDLEIRNNYREQGVKLGIGVNF